MPYSIQGIGSMLYGQRDFRADRTYVTTEWFAFLAIPIFPVRSLRVAHVGTTTAGIQSTERYRIYEKTLPNWKQVLCVYAFFAICAAWFAILLGLMPHFNPFGGLSPSVRANIFLPMLPIPGVIPYLLRYLPRRRARMQR